jgi:DtxR family transcriptional regulator, Mn-dependent transcriptional regulator
MTARAGASADDYLAALYEMAEEHLPTVQAEMARWMGLSPPSVSEAVKRLRRDGLLRNEGRELAFTPAGREAAVRIVRRHRIAERFLVDVLGLAWHKSHAEAEVWQHAISDDVEALIVASLDDPGTCVHGNPIPGSRHPVDQTDLQPLHRYGRGASVVLGRLTEDLELDHDVMRFFEESGLMPGASILVEGVGPDGTMSLKVGRRTVGLGLHLADNVWVRGR